MIDEALLRPGRFDEIIHVPTPDLASRIEILRVYTQRMPLASDVDVLQVAQQTHGCTGAELETLCKEAAIDALNHSIHASHVVCTSSDSARMCDSDRTLIDNHHCMCVR
jgi:transitional endoplasmic reticulum ATPase